MASVEFPTYKLRPTFRTSRLRNYSPLIPAAFITLAHLAISFCMNMVNCSGVPPTGSVPPSRNRALKCKAKKR